MGDESLSDMSSARTIEEDRASSFALFDYTANVALLTFTLTPPR
jgi:hypothetical protein